MITKTAGAIIKQAARWQDFIVKLSPESVRRLHSSGIIKPIEAYVKGIEQGSRNIANRLGYRIIRTPYRKPRKLLSERRHYLNTETDSVTQEIRSLFPERANMSKTTHDVLQAFITRHEVNEAQAAERYFKAMANAPEKTRVKVLNNLGKIDPDIRAARKSLGDEEAWVGIGDNKRVFGFSNQPGTFSINGASPMDKRNKLGSHLDIDVLIKERKLMDRFPYQNNPGLRQLRRLRRLEGETQYLDSAGEYAENSNPLERFNKVNIKNLHRNRNKVIEINEGRIKTVHPFYS